MNFATAVFFIVVVFATQTYARDCVTGFREVDRSVKRIEFSEPLDWESSRKVCNEAYTDHVLVYSLDTLSEADRGLCGQEDLAPLDVFQEGSNVSLSISGEHGEASEEEVKTFLKYKEKSPDPDTFAVGALNLSTGLWHFVDIDLTFGCVLCQGRIIDDFETVPSHWGIYGYTNHRYFNIKLESLDQRTESNVTLDEMGRLKHEISQALREASLTFQNSSLDANNRLVLHFLLSSNILESVASNNAVVIVGNFSMTHEDVSFCPQEEMVGPDGEVTVWPVADDDAKVSHTNTDFETWIIIERICAFNHTQARAAWGPPNFWEIVWSPCTQDEQYANEQIYHEYLGPEIVNRHKYVLESFASTPVNTTTLQDVAVVVNREIINTKQIYDEVRKDLMEILGAVILDESSDDCAMTESRVHLITAATVGDSPLVGFSLSYDHTVKVLQNVTLTFNRRHTKEFDKNEAFSLVLSDGLTDVLERLAFAVFWIDRTDLKKAEMKYFIWKREQQSIEVTIRLEPIAGKASAMSLNNDEYYVDIGFVEREPEGTRKKLDPTCVAWNNDLGDWTARGCRRLESKRDLLTLCRCRAKYFLPKDDAMTAIYALKVDYSSSENNRMAKFFRDSNVLVLATVVACILCAFGLALIKATAICFNKWRQNTTHKILMYTVMALTCNLVLGFITSYVQMDTESVGCLVVGVFRHYSFLAMFLWMLVLSGLQMKRLLTVAGAKATTHLILKVAAFAWGLPLFPIAALLAWDTRFYREDRFDRGYCYPEGLVFQLSVQAPVGIILLVNGGVIVAIVNHIFGCCDGEITKHSMQERTEQMNKLKTSLSSFLLFGFTWGFHFLSEERVVSSDFVFEYLFLMTMAIHIFILALFFVVLQKSTRENWVNFLKERKQQFTTLRAARSTKVRNAS